MIFTLVLFLSSVLAGGVAAVAGFGIGSLVTPVLSLGVDTKLAVAVVSIPHFIATAIRFWLIRSHLDLRVFIRFGVMSAVGGLLGALAHAYVAAPSLTLIFGIILIFAGFMGATGLGEKMRFHGKAAWMAGALSGTLGGLVGNQGGIRSAALLGFNIPKESFVATATAIGLVVDAARMPVYFFSEWNGIVQNAHWIAVATVGVVIGTFFGMAVLKKLPERVFRRVVSGLIFVLGAFMFYKGIVE